jgi:hypothetical protein
MRAEIFGVREIDDRRSVGIHPHPARCAFATACGKINIRAIRASYSSLTELEQDRLEPDRLDERHMYDHLSGGA